MSLPTDVDLVNLAAAIYQAGSVWDYLDTGADDEVYWGLKRLPGCDVVVFRGSITAPDWWHDFQAEPISTRIGTVHEGFFWGIEKMWHELRPMLSGAPVAVTGHSLGAARADMLCGFMTEDFQVPARRAVFGEPRPGYEDFCMGVRKIPGASYCNEDARGHDRVTDVPITLPHMFDFSRPTALVNVTSSPTWIERLDGLFDYHHIQLYQSAVAAHLKEPAT